MFQPKILNPTPDPWFVRELKRIDPALRVVWAYETYFKNTWAIEKELSAEEYFKRYVSLLEQDAPRFVDQPIFDTNQMEYDEHGQEIGYKQVGVRKFDLAPRFEQLFFTDNLGEESLTALKRAYAWERNHPISRLKIEKEQEIAAKAEAQKKKRIDAAMEGIDEALLETRNKVQFGYGETRNET
jgi:hypothetical protein